MGLVATVAVALLVLPWVIALALARRHHLDATAVGILAAVSVPLSGLWLTWVTLAKAEGPGTPASSPGITMVADQLAVAVKEQWIVEAAIRRLNDPYPLPVSWKAADRSLGDAWHSLVELATSGIGWPRSRPRGPGPPALMNLPARAAVTDLRGKKVALNKGSNVHYLLVKALEKAGLKYTDIQPVFLAPADARAAFSAVRSTPG